MKIYKEKVDTEIETIKPYDESKDRGIVKSPADPSKHNKIPDEIKEIISIDALELGVRKAAEIHGISKTAAAEIANKSMAKTEVLASRYDIQNLATAKLMTTLNLLDPYGIEKERDKVAVISGLSKVIETMEDGSKGKNGERVVHLHMYAPNQKKESEYDTIEVGGVVS